MIDDVAENIRNERRAEIDRNPSLGCAGCDASIRAQELTDDDGWELPETPDDPILCPDCAEQSVGTRTVEERADANQSLGDFNAGP